MRINRFIAQRASVQHSEKATMAATASSSTLLVHKFWDDVLGLGDAPSIALNAISTVPNPPASAANDLDVSHWIDESLEAGQQTVYKTPIVAGAGPFTVTQAYKTAARKLAEKRIALAGARLAKILNEDLR